MPAGRRPHLKYAALALVAAVLALAALPFWLGPALPVLARPFHISIGSYRRQGYARFILRDVVYRHAAVRVTIGEIEGDSPLIWAWRRLFEGDEPVVGTDWSVVVVPPARPAGPRRIVGMETLHPRLVRLASRLRRWLPRARALRGSVRWPQGGFRLASADWDRGGLAFAGLAWKWGVVGGRVRLASDGAFRLEATEPDRSLAAAAIWSGAEASGRITAWGQPIELSARYGPVGWMPAVASAVAGNWDLPAARVHLAGYRDLRGGGRADWRDGAFSVSWAMDAAPLSPATPPLRLVARGKGDRRRWSVQALDVEFPFGRLVLNRPVSFGYRGAPAYDGATLSLSADLAALPSLGARGRVAGAIELSGRAESLPTASGRITGRGVAWKWAPAGDFVLTGSCDFQRRVLAGVRLSASWSGAPLQAALPAGARASELAVSAAAEGPWAAVSHRGSARISGLSLPSLKLDAASLEWRGQGLAIEAFAARLAAGATTLAAGGAASRDSVRLATLSFSPEGRTTLRLAAPAEIRWQPRWSVTPFELRGPSSEIAGACGAEGMRLRLVRIPSAWARSIAPLRGPDFTVSSADLSAAVRGGRLSFTARIAASLALSGMPADVSARAAGEGRRIALEELRIDSKGRVAAHASGELPFFWSVSARHWEADPQAPLHLRAGVDPTSPLWAAWGARLGLALSQPAATLVLDGSLAHPSGRLHLAVVRLAAVPGESREKVPSLDNLVLDAHADRSAIVLDRLSGAILGQPLSASGRLPMGGAAWAGLRSRPAGFDWAGADARLSVPDIEVAALAPVLPALVAPAGRLSLAVQAAGGSLSGALRFDGLSLRPISALGLVQGISGEVDCSGRTLKISRFVASVGGAQVTVGGSVQLPRGEPPRYSLTVRGSSVPLVRQVDLLVRSNLDLRIESRGRQTTLAGSMAVTDGLLLADLSELLPGGLSAAPRPAPYFSVSAAPFNHWLLDVAVSADRSLRAQTPLFSGRGSAAVRLSGSLADPRAVGHLSIDQGQISLPFATFSIQFGEIRLGLADPYHPQLDLQATARRSDYDLTLTATGPVDAPVLAFTSNPALPSDQILALVMAGQSPQTGGLLGATSSQAANLGAYVGQSLLSGLSGQPGSNRLTVISGQELSVSGRPTYEIEYRLSPRWSLVGNYDIFDDYNAGVKWRAYSKGGNP